MNDITKIKVDGEPESSYKLFPKNREFEKRAGGNTGSHSGVQPDWNQNDSTQPDYVKNRPFYTATSETVLVEESTESFANPGGNIYVAQIEPNFEATVGGTYKVSWDGTTYESTCVDIDGYLYVGNLSIAGVGSDTGEPFLIFVSNDSGIEIYTLDASASHTISVSKFAVEVVKIDKKYLPDAVVQPDWNQNDDTQPDYVKNRPFYTTPAVKNLVNGRFNFAYNSAIGFYASDAITIELIEGKTYKVTLDGVEYETVCKVLQAGMLYIGASEFISGGTPPSDMPFVCAYNTGNGSVIFATITDGSHEIIIKEVFAQIVKIPEQYIPEMSSVTLLSSTSDSTKKFKITVDDSGTLTTTEVT